MRKSVYAALSALFIVSAPLGATAFAQASDVPEKCAKLTDAQARADCIRAEKGGK